MFCWLITKWSNARQTTISYLSRIDLFSTYHASSPSLNEPDHGHISRVRFTLDNVLPTLVRYFLVIFLSRSLYSKAIYLPTFSSSQQWPSHQYDSHSRTGVKLAVTSARWRLVFVLAYRNIADRRKIQNYCLPNNCPPVALCPFPEGMICGGVFIVQVHCNDRNGDMIPAFDVYIGTFRPTWIEPGPKKKSPRNFSWPDGLTPRLLWYS